MKQKKLKKMLFKLAQMCNRTRCEDCLLSFDDNRCMLKHAGLPDIAKSYFDNGQQYEGTVWIRFEDMEAFKAASGDIVECLDTHGDYNVNVYLKSTNSKSAMVGLRADDAILEKLVQVYGEDNVKLVMKVPEEVLSSF